MRKKKLLTMLVLLMTAATGAWADDTTVFELSGSTATTGTLTFGTDGVEAGTVKIHNNTDEIAGIKMSSSYNYSGGKYFTIKPATGSFKKGDKLSIAVCFNNSDDTKNAKAAIYADDGTTLLYTTAQGINGRTNKTDDPAVEEYVLTQDTESLIIGRNGNTSTFVTTLKVDRPESTGGAGSYSVSVNDGQLNPTTWTGKAGDATDFGALPIEGVTEGQTVTLQYDGRMKVKGVKATTDAQPAATAFAADEYNEGSWDGTKVVFTKKQAPKTPTAIADATSDATWSDEWYTVSGNVTITGYVTLGADAHLILQDGATLTINGTIWCEDYNLYIYGQDKRNGQLKVLSSRSFAIQCYKTGKIVEIHGGEITAETTGNIGFGVEGANVYGGKLTATGTGYGINFYNGGLNVYGGEVVATSNSTSSAYGIQGPNYTLTVYGGKVKGTGGAGALSNGFNCKLKSGTDAIKFYFSTDGTTWDEGTSYATPTDGPKPRRYAKAE